MRDVFFLTCGRFGTGPRSTATTNTVAVAIGDDGDLVLVDAGWSQGTCAEPRKSLGRLRAMTLGLRVRASDSIASQLSAMGLDPGRVRAIVATHLHLDHVGGVEDFPNAEVIVSRTELEAYWNAPRRLGYRARDLARAGRIRAVGLFSGPTYGFPASADVAGNGEIVLLDARGHTPGSVAVALRARGRTYLHVGDAVYERWEYGRSPRGPSPLARLTAWRRRELVRTYECLRACEADPRRPTIVPSHDPKAFETLPHAPES
jgi:glyoxylase-like metal-dependent hydrolase (beta-lactamase superfamily II)